MEASPKKVRANRGGAVFVAAGILLSRFAGLIRERAFAHYFGNTAAADVFRAALRIPNLLQNLFGEGALSASFIPVYASLSEKDPKEAARVAGIILSLLSLLMTVLVALGMLGTPLLIDLIVPGFEGEKRAAAIELVRILFPGIGLLVVSAFCLGVLNSHRRFFISYSAPVLWNGAMIATLMAFQNEDGYRFAANLAWGAVVGSALQVLVQLPSMLRYMRGMRPSLDIKNFSVMTIVTRFVPNLFSRGVIQISAYIEGMIASFLPTGALAAIGYAQLLYTLPTSLFGTAVAASQLVDMSTADKKDQVAHKLHQGMRHIAFFIIPSAIAFVLMGHVLAAILFKTGKFQDEETFFVWHLLAASAIGLLASTQGRLLATAFFALKNTKEPLRCSIVRVVTSTTLAVLFAVVLPKWIPMSAPLATAGISFASGIAAVLEFFLLRRSLRKELPLVPLANNFLIQLTAAAIIAGSIGAAFYQSLLPAKLPDWMSGGVAVLIFGAIYGGLCLAFKVPEAIEMYVKIRRRLPI
ncbi:MAG: murein biosynthesis integral membrane protein MurJ [Proteobacteria bacterium]|nr:MAG: murein biosynthesis integral membrane protein MurJ [Pseudomonadota bacterium]